MLNYNDFQRQILKWLALIALIGCNSQQQQQQQPQQSQQQQQYADEQLAEEETAAAFGSEYCKQLRFVSRQQWGAKEAQDSTGELDRDVTGNSSSSSSGSNQNLPFNPTRVFVHQAWDGRTCYDVDSCSIRLQSMQAYHQHSKGWPDISYNFLISGDGSIYEGRGFQRAGFHTLNYNQESLGVALIGTFHEVRPPSRMFEALERLIGCALDTGRLSEDYLLHGHRDARCTICPGDAAYARLAELAHFQPGPLEQYTCPRQLSFKAALSSKDGALDPIEVRELSASSSDFVASDSLGSPVDSLDSNGADFSLNSDAINGDFSSYAPADNQAAALSSNERRSQLLSSSDEGKLVQNGHQMKTINVNSHNRLVAVALHTHNGRDGSNMLPVEEATTTTAQPIDLVEEAFVGVLRRRLSNGGGGGSGGDGSSGAGNGVQAAQLERSQRKRQTHLSQVQPGKPHLKAEAINKAQQPSVVLVNAADGATVQPSFYVLTNGRTAPGAIIITGGGGGGGGGTTARPASTTTARPTTTTARPAATTTTTRPPTTTTRAPTTTARPPAAGNTTRPPAATPTTTRPPATTTRSPMGASGQEGNPMSQPMGSLLNRLLSMSFFGDINLF